MRTPFCFVHAADLHLDVPFQGLRRASSAATHTLCQAPIVAWDALVQLTIDRQAAFLLLAGDICDGAERAVTAQLRFLNGLQRLSAHGIRTFIVRGVDDPPGPWAGIHQWPVGVHCFGPDRVEAVPVTRQGERLAVVHGISYSATRHPGHGVTPSGRDNEPGFHIGLLHGSVEPSEGLVPCDPQKLDELRATDLDYWALGYDHRHRMLSQERPWIVYPGTLQGRGFTSHETGPKGAVVVGVENGVVNDIVFHALDSVRLVTVEADISTLSGVTDITRVLAERAAALRGNAAARSLLARAVLFGSRNAVVNDATAGGLHEQVLDALREQASEDRSVWWDSVLDLTEPAAGHDTGEREPVVRLQALVASLRREPGRLERFLANDLAKLAGAGAVLPDAPLDPSDADALLTSAERVAVDYLEREQS